MLNKFEKKYFGILLPIIFIISLIIYPYVVVNMGEEILLETIPYDPTDVFRGDYVELRYKISELDESYIHESVKIDKEERYIRQPMFAILKQEGEVYVVDYLLDNKPSEGIYLKCNVYRPYRGNIDIKNKEEMKLNLDYNINRFYLKEGTGLDLEEASRKGELLGRVKVLNGKGILLDIIEKN